MTNIVENAPLMPPVEDFKGVFIALLIKVHQFLITLFFGQIIALRGQNAQLI
jgi:hypothetical protein